MSDTPRTDEQAGALIDAEEVVPADFARELERENAALREDKERLVAMVDRWLKVATDCHQEMQEVGYSEYNITVGLMCDTRALLDAAMKEEQP